MDSELPKPFEIPTYSQMKSLVINLSKSTDRWELFLRANSCNLVDIQRIEAVDGRLLTDKWKYLSRWIYLIHEPNKFNIMPAIGCFLSHRKAWQYVLDHDLPHALILEDDARVTDLTTDFLTAYEANPPPFDWVKLHVHRRIARTRQEPLGIQLAGVELCVDMAGSKSNAAYIITNAGARKALAMARLRAPVDHLEWLYAVYSVIFVQTWTNVMEVDSALTSNITVCPRRSLWRAPAMVRIWLVRHTAFGALLKSNLKVTRELARQHQDKTHELET